MLFCEKKQHYYTLLLFTINIVKLAKDQTFNCVFCLALDYLVQRH